MSYDRVQNIAGQLFHRVFQAASSAYASAQNIARLQICKVYTGCWIWLNKPEYALIMSQYAWIYLNNTEYD